MAVIAKRVPKPDLGAPCGLRRTAGGRLATATVITVDIVRKPKDRIGVAMHPGRWEVERVSGRIIRNRRRLDPRPKVRRTVMTSGTVLKEAQIAIGIWQNI